MNGDLVRFVDSISRDKNIDKEGVYLDIEAAMVSAIRKAHEDAEDVQVRINRTSGEIEATVDGEPISVAKLGRIAAQTGKQVMIQKIREDERGAIFEEYSQLVGTVVTGSLARFEGGSAIVSLGRGEGILPRSEQIPGDSLQMGERIRAMILDVREDPNQVRIVLSQTHPDYIRRLFELEVPEVGERIIVIQALAREAGYRTKLAVSSIDSKVDAVGACVGVRGSRIRNIVDELGGEKIDIVRWNESSQVLITNALKPAEVHETFLSFETGRATVIVDESQLSLAIGKRGQNVRLAAQLTGWDIDILTPAEYDKSVDEMEKTFREVEGVADVLLDKLLAMGIISLGDLVEVGPDPIAQGLEIEPDLAALIVQTATQQQAAKKLAAAEAKTAASAADAAKKVESSDAADPDTTDAPACETSETADAGSSGEPKAAEEQDESTPVDQQEPVASVVATEPETKESSTDAPDVEETGSTSDTLG